MDPEYQTPALASATTSLTTLDVPQFPHLYIEGMDIVDLKLISNIPPNSMNWLSILEG